MTRSWPSWALPLVLVLLTVAPAAAQDASDDEARDQRARVHFQAGTNYFQVSDYENAVREYRQAFELSGRVELMYNLYLCHERLGHLAQAARWLERYLADAPNPRRRENLRARLATMRRRLEEGATETDPGATGEGESPVGPEDDAEEVAGDDDEGDDGGVTGQGEGAAEAPPDGAIEPGSDAATGAAARDAAAPVSASDGGGGISGGAVASWIVAGVFAGAFAAFGGVALAEDARLADACGEGGCPPSETELMRATMIVADLSLAAAGAAAILGLVLALIDGGGGDDATPSAWLRGDGGGWTEALRF
ncbi:MAG TPA: tetratricopeptide repeat protein [Sandaracinaceae bacterium LLY-WYZ-13_1]|nr:tetratricopeptide repeat protein [Sandaracinaceae bacterium LLY-WYZ-13_1]